MIDKRKRYKCECNIGEGPSMKIFKSQREIEKYYNEATNTYEFVENSKLLNVKFVFDVDVDSNINAGNIDAWDIKARDINARDIDAWNINAWDIDTCDINAGHINAGHINAWDIKARDINAWNINAWNINAWDIKARDINARDINARDIDAWNISFYAVCFAYFGFVCTTIVGRRANSKYFCLDSEVIIRGGVVNE